MRKLKFAVFGAFLLFAACAFFFAGNTRTAQADDASVLPLVEGYKTWEQVSKNLEKNNALEITNSVFSG